MQSNHVKNVTTYNIKYLLNTSFHHNEMLRHITSIFTVIETNKDWSSGYSGILYYLNTELQCDNNYTIFQLRRDMRNKLDDNLFMKIFKASLKNLSNDDDNFGKKYSSKDALIALKKNMYVKGLDKRNYSTKEHKFDDKLCLTALSLAHSKISFYCYSPLDLDLFIYKFDSEKHQTVIIRTHIYENSIPGINIFLMKKPTKNRKVGFSNV